MAPFQNTIFFNGAAALMGQNLPIIEASQSHSHTQHYAGLF